jgi:hypothetical protein
MRITPGYDFQPTEVPTNATLQQMVAGMSITGIDIQQIDTSLQGVKVGDTASLPAEGWMRRDSRNGLWVQSATGPVMLWRANWGGWETVRFRTGAKLDTFGNTDVPISTGRGILGMVPDNDSSESNCFCRPSIGLTSNQSKGQMLKYLDTGVSGSFCRLLGRGGMVVLEMQARPDFPMYLQPDGAAGVTWAVFGLPVTSITRVTSMGLALRPLLNQYSLGWLFGAVSTEQ